MASHREGLLILHSTVRQKRADRSAWPMSSREVRSRRFHLNTMAFQKPDGSGSIYQRGNVWWVKVYVDGKPHRESSKSEKYEDAKRLRDKLLGQKHRGEISGGHPDRVTVGELLDDVLEYATTNIRPSTEYIWKLVIEKNLRPFFGTLKAQKVTTEKLEEYRRKRIAEGRSDATANRELSILRTAFH